jgi:hypothetical protein
MIKRFAIIMALLAAPHGAADGRHSSGRPGALPARAVRRVPGAGGPPRCRPGAPRGMGPGAGVRRLGHAASRGGTRAAAAFRGARSADRRGGGRGGRRGDGRGDVRGAGFSGRFAAGCGDAGRRGVRDHRRDGGRAHRRADAADAVDAGTAPDPEHRRGPAAHCARRRGGRPPHPSASDRRPDRTKEGRLPRGGRPFLHPHPSTLRRQRWCASTADDHRSRPETRVRLRSADQGATAVGGACLAGKARSRRMPTSASVANGAQRPKANATGR